MLFWFIKQTFYPPLPRIGSSLSLTKTSRGPGSDMGHVSQPHMDVDSSCLVYSAVQPGCDGPWSCFPRIPIPGCDRPYYPSWRSCFPSITGLKTLMDPATILLILLFAFLCFSVAFLLRKTGSQNLAEIFFIFDFSWANWLIKWPSQLGNLSRGPGCAAVRRFLHLLFSQMIWLYSY